jgi:hypothetical protein
VPVLLSVWNILAPTGQIFIKFGVWVFFEKKTLEEFD